MRIRWFGQSAFLLEGERGRVFIDPFGDMSEAAAKRGMRFEYPPIRGVSADLVLVTHEHFDHNAAGAIEGSPAVIRSRAGTHASPLGEVVGIASEHDAQAGTQRGDNTIFRFELDGLRVCHFGDFGQAALRPQQREAIAAVDLLFIPVGAGPTIGPEQAFEIVSALEPRIVVPMHYRTPAVGFLDPPDAFLDRYGESVSRIGSSELDTGELPEGSPRVAVPAAPAA